MQKETKIKKVFIHTVEYYKNSELKKSMDLAEVIDLNKYWETVIEFMKKLNGEKFVELDNYITLSKCHDCDYDYMVNKIIERIETEKQ